MLRYLLISTFLISFAAEPLLAAKKKAAGKKAASQKLAKAKKPALIQSEKLLKKAEELQTGSLIITEDDKFLVEKNWESPLSFYYVQGITPSIVTLMMGSLIDEGKIQLESTMIHYIPEWLDSRGQIPVQQLLQHTSGFADDEKDPWFKSTDTWTWLKSKQTNSDPGANFNLSDINSLLLGMVVAKATDSTPEDLVAKKIFEPLKIQKWGWDKDKFGHANTAGGLRLRTYDLLKIGNLIAKRGVWNDKKIISDKWLDQIEKVSDKNPIHGLNWWVHEESGLKAIYAYGYQGQYVVIIPEKKIVAVRLRNLVPVEQNKPEYDWTDFPKELIQSLK